MRDRLLLASKTAAVPFTEALVQMGVESYLGEGGLGPRRQRHVGDQHGGRIEITSEVGQGTEACILLPLTEGAVLSGAPERSRPGCPAVPRPSSWPKTTRTSASGCRPHWRPWATACSSLRTGRRRCEWRAGRLDLLLSDVIMPRIGGRALARAVRQALDRR